MKQKGPVNGKVKADYSKGGNRVPLGKKANLSEPISRILPKGKLRNHTKFAQHRNILDYSFTIIKIVKRGHVEQSRNIFDTLYDSGPDILSLSPSFSLSISDH